MTEAEFTQLLDRFQKGICTPQEKEQLEQWLDTRSEGGSPFKSSSEKQKIKMALRESIYRKAEISRRRSVLFFPSAGRSVNVRMGLRVAASILMVVAVVYGLWKSDIMGKSLLIYQTEAGQKKEVTLPDNTIVTLNGNSSLSYRNNWKDKRFRSVDLSGEAYFKVTSNAQKPFVVNTAGISIKVLGTTFNVKSYDEDERVETTLVEGKVSIEKVTKDQPAPEIIELSPDQKATFSKESREITLKQVKPESEAAWIRGSLVFEDEPFSEIIKDLERMYGVKIFVKDKAALQCTFNIRLEGESLEEVLKLFSLSEDVKYRIEDRQAWIEGNLCDGKTN
jgi:ferric-dicitrate binding protein FerR (iron transport regulator)